VVVVAADAVIPVTNLRDLFKDFQQARAPKALAFFVLRVDLWCF